MINSAGLSFLNSATKLFGEIMNWLQKLFGAPQCDHRWKRSYCHASLSERDRSGRLETGEKCRDCGKEQNRVIVYDTDGRVERDYVFPLKGKSNVP
jgi:hypothetical protein